jgi:predicted porin
MDFLPVTWDVKPFNLNVQLQNGQPVPRVDGVHYQNAIGLSAVFEMTDDYSFGLAYNRAQIEDLENPAVQAAGIQGDAEAILFGARWFDEQWYLGLTVARLSNHETTDKGTYFDGWGSELYTRYRLVKGYWLVAGYNWLSPDEDQAQAGQYELLYGVVGLRYSIDDFKRLAFVEWRLDSTTYEDGAELGNVFTIGVRWDF